MRRRLDVPRRNSMAKEETMATRSEVDRKLLERLVCPLTKGPLIYDRENQELISEQAKLAYPIRDGIPIMLVDEARVIND
jgi:uncharacterized protein YbaR (Trm112 family)